MAAKRIRRLYRSREKKIAGVCGGIASYLALDPILIRLLWLGFTFLGGAGVFIYIIAWIVIPEQPERGSTNHRGPQAQTIYIDPE